LASEKNRLHKGLTDSGVRLGVVVSDLHGQSARTTVKTIIAGKSPQEVIKLASRRLKASREEIFDALQGDLTELPSRPGRHDSPAFSLLCIYSLRARVISRLPGGPASLSTLKPAERKFLLTSPFAQ
jgi:hypothetical protein